MDYADWTPELLDEFAYRYPECPGCGERHPETVSCHQAEIDMDRMTRRGR